MIKKGRSKQKRKVRTNKSKSKNKKAAHFSTPVSTSPISTARSLPPLNIDAIQTEKGTTKGLVVGNGSPDQVVTNPTNGQLYVDEETYSTYLHVKDHGWIKLNSWEPYVGEGVPSKENPANPISGDQYCNVLTGDFYHYVEGFDWILLTGKPGPAGPTGPAANSNVYTASAESKTMAMIDPNVGEKVKWCTELQDDTYELTEDDTSVLIKNGSTKKCRFKIEARVVIETVSNQSPDVLGPRYLELTLNKDKQPIKGMLDRQSSPNFNTLSISTIVEVYGQLQHKYDLQLHTNMGGMVYKIVSGYLSVVQLG